MKLSALSLAGLDSLKEFRGDCSSDSSADPQIEEKCPLLNLIARTVFLGKRLLGLIEKTFSLS
jgi:hypothetical protein